MRILFLVVTLFAACSAPKSAQNSAPDQSTFIEIAEEQLGASAQCLKNNSESMVLCISEEDSHSMQPRKTISFMVIKLDDSSVLYESSVDGGSVKWFDDQRLEIFNTPGYVRQDQSKDDFTTIYDVLSGVSKPKTEYLKE